MLRGGSETKAKEGRKDFEEGELATGELSIGRWEVWRELNSLQG